MADATSALTIVTFPGRFGRLDQGGPGLILRERRGLRLTEVAAWDATGLDLPGPNASAPLGDGVALNIGPDRWLLVDTEASPDNAAVVDQSHGRVVLRLTGAAVREVLSKGCPIDLDRFAQGDVAATRLGPFATLLHGIEGGVDLYVARGYAQACWEWLTDAAGEYGYEVPIP
ncbi:MAG: sarcosine oxidase subunit gamma family protein [Alphaproteobacteria bacterium]